MSEPLEKITFFVVHAHRRDWTFDCTGAKAVLIQVNPRSLSVSNPIGNHDTESSLEDATINLTLKGLNRTARIYINTDYDGKA